MRLFSAVAIAPEALHEIAHLQDALRDRVEVHRWQPVGNMHLTVHFFGEVDAGIVPRLAERLSDASHVTSPFDLRLGALGAFPKRGHPRVLWLGVEDPSQALHALERTMRAAIADLGVLHEARPYSPHITLAREPRGTVRMGELTESMQRAPVPWRVDHAALYRSTLTPQGALYEVLHRFPFGGEARC